MGERRGRGSERAGGILVGAWLGAFSVLTGCGSVGGGDGSDAGRGPGRDGGSISGGDGSALPDMDGGDVLLDDGGTRPRRDAAVVMGGPGCGLASAAFCDTFEAPFAGGRAGELDERYWSGSRLSPAGPTSDGLVFGLIPATLRPTRAGASTSRLPACRAELPDRVSPEQDMLVCDPNENIASGHLLVAASAQNYGQSSVRIRQPFDFADRTGTIVFDAELEGYGLLGWVSVEVTEDPTPVPGFAQLSNFEGTSIPRNGIALQISHAACGTTVALANVFNDYVETDMEHGGGDGCVEARWGHLSHVEVRLSRTHVEVLASDASDDGVTFGPLTSIFSADVALAFDRGYVSLTTHNHATLKYTETGGMEGFTNLDAWIARFDNVGFDGPVLSDWREHEAPNSHAPRDTGVTNIGWITPDEAHGPAAAITIPGVALSGMSRARLALTTWHCMPCGGDPSRFVLRYRVNGNAWHERRLSAHQIAALESGSGAIGEMLDVPIAELHDGDNTVELATVDVPQGYPPGALNVELVLEP